jgi:hypothetical protein
MKINHLVIFCSLLIIDIVYVFYLKYVSDNKIHKACAWASIITLINGVIFINYSVDVFTFISAMAGAYAGTYISMKFINNKK